MVDSTWDAIVVGSGFGGSIAACRLAEAGKRVLVLERGRRWGAAEFPRDITDIDCVFWRYPRRRRSLGLYDVRFFSGLGTVVASGVGGGSLVYANIHIRPDALFFADERWPAPPGFTTELSGMPGGRDLVAYGAARRISLSHWARVIQQRSDRTVSDLLSQHFATAVGRFNGVNHRLRLVLEKDGLEPVVSAYWKPALTPDRLDALMSLMADCALERRTPSDDGPKYALD